MIRTLRSLVYQARKSNAHIILKIVKKLKKETICLDRSMSWSNRYFTWKMARNVRASRTFGYNLFKQSDVLKYLDKRFRFHNLYIKRGDNHSSFNIVVYGREIKWINDIHACSKEGPTFVVCGAIHLFGLLSMLKRNGFKISPLYKK